MVRYFFDANKKLHSFAVKKSTHLAPPSVLLLAFLLAATPTDRRPFTWPGSDAGPKVRYFFDVKLKNDTR